jgi:uncharacterized membrane protein YfcA
MMCIDYNRKVTILLSDPWFFAVAIPAVILFGISKSGFGGAFGAIAVPIMALVISPVQAAGILLPILCLMDLLGLWAYRGQWVRSELRLLLPAALLGIGLGTALFGYLNADIIRLMVGAVALLFAVHYWRRLAAPGHQEGPPLPPAAGIISAGCAGFTSFIAHAGGPPLSMYLLRRPLGKTEFVATTVVFFAVVNYAKLVPYAWLGQLNAANLTASLLLAPFAPVGIVMGMWLHNRVSERLFFRIACLFLFAVALKLIGDGFRGLF